MQQFYEEITRFVFKADDPAPSDVIWIPGGDSPELPEKAAELYRQGLASILIPSGRFSITKGGLFHRVRILLPGFAGARGSGGSHFTGIPGGVYPPERSIFQRIDRCTGDCREKRTALLQELPCPPGLPVLSVYLSGCGNPGDPCRCIRDFQRELDGNARRAAEGPA